MASDAVSASTELDIFATKAVQTLTLEMTETAYKPIASLDQSNLEFLIPADHDTYIDLNLQLYSRGKLTKRTERTWKARTSCVTNNLLHSLFSQCNITLNSVTINHAADLYHYRAYFETLLTYSSDAVTLHLTDTFWCYDNDDMGPCDLTATATDATNKGSITRWDRINQSKEVEMVGRLHRDICNVPTHLLPGVRIQIKLTKARREFYLMNKDVDSKVVFKFLDSQLLVKCVRANPVYLVAHNMALQAGAIAKYNLTRAELKTFTFSNGSQLLSIDNAVLGPIPKRFLFTVIKNNDSRLLGYESVHVLSLYGLFLLYVNGKHP